MTRRIEIKEIDGTRDNPNNIHTWELFIEDGKVHIHSHSGAEGKDCYVFPAKKGMSIFLFNSSYQKYAYWRNEDFQAFLDKHFLKRLVKKDPNGIWDEESFRYIDRRKDGTIITDGEKAFLPETYTHDDYQDQHPGTSCFHSHELVRVTNANWVKIDKALYSLLDWRELDKLLSTFGK